MSNNRYDADGYDADGYDADGYDADGYNRDGYHWREDTDYIYNQLVIGGLNK